MPNPVGRRYKVVGAAVPGRPWSESITVAVVGPIVVYLRIAVGE